MSVQPLLFGDEPWTQIRDGNKSAMALFERHYSKVQYRDGRTVNRFVGPGYRIVLMTPCARALFVWRKFISKDNQGGINCSIFRNESAIRSSDLIKAAMAIAWERWPGARLYTYVNPRKVRSKNPGCCFKVAGWRRCGITKTRRLIVLECMP